MRVISILLALSVLPFHTYSADGPQNVIDANSSSDSGGEQSRIQLKRKVAIARFSNETQSGATFLIDDAGDRIGKQAADILSARLSETGRFLMFERLDADKTSTEQMLAGLAEDGVSVDYLIVGSVSEFGRSRESDTNIFSRKKIQRAYAKVNVRLIDVATGRIIFASEGAGEATSEASTTFGVGSSAGFDQTLTDLAISEAISTLTSNLVENMTKKPWKSFFLAEQDGMYLISGGKSQGLNAGLKLQYSTIGNRIKNPQTGAFVTLPGKKIGTVEVVSSFGEDDFNEISFVRIESGVIDKPLSEYIITEIN